MLRTPKPLRSALLALSIAPVLALMACGSASRPDGAPAAKLFVAGDVDPSACSGGSKSGEGVLRAGVYDIPLTTSGLPDFDALTPVASICTTKLDVTARHGYEGFPGVTERFEWFAVDYKGAFTVNSQGDYRFRLTSDDGARLFIDGALAIDQDGMHGAVQGETQIHLKDGPHKIRVSYWQGPGDCALILEAALPNQPYEVFHVDRPLGPKIDLLPAQASIEGGKYTVGSGCASKEPKTENGLRCPGSGCGTTCSGGSSLDYIFETVPDKRYTATFKIDDYSHNCSDKLSAGFFANGDRVVSFVGAGVDGWVPVTFDFIAGGKTTTLRVTEENDACCRCNNNCNPTCAPLYGDLNLYVDSVMIADAR